VLIRVKMIPFFSRKRSCSLASLSPVGKDAFNLKLKPKNRHVSDYLPGQFAFLRNWKNGSED
jgi:NAD(P)H-flavin reductase